MRVLISGYCDLRVDNINDAIIDEYIKFGYSMIAVNTTVNCSLMEHNNSNISHITEYIDEIPIPKSSRRNKYLSLTVLNRLTLQITTIGQLKQIIKYSQNYSMYNILAVEPLVDEIIKELVTLEYVDIITCNTNTMVSTKDYAIAIKKNIYFEIPYAEMFVDSVSRQDILTLAYLFNIKGNLKNIILTSGNLNNNIRSPDDVMNIGLSLGFSMEQSKESIADWCHSIILKCNNRKVISTTISFKGLD